MAKRVKELDNRFPALQCDKCNKLTLHQFSHTEHRSFKTVNGRCKMSRADREAAEQRSTMFVHIWECGVCGHKRVWGNTVEDL